MLVVEKEASTLNTLHGFANFVKNGTRKIISSNRYQRFSTDIAHTYFRSSLRILLTVFLETKTQLWKLMWAILGCCIGISGSPLHPSLCTLCSLVSKQTFLEIFPFVMNNRQKLDNMRTGTEIVNPCITLLCQLMCYFIVSIMLV